MAMTILRLFEWLQKSKGMKMKHMMMVDLHTHTSASDGQYSPSQVVCMAKKAGITCLAVTDHDTISGLQEARGAGKEYGITVVRGIELGAKEKRHLHIVGLGFCENAIELQMLCNKLRQSRDERKYRIVDFLREKGIEISLDEVTELAGGEVIARPHFAQVMLRHGYVSSIREAFDRYLDTDEYQRIERFKAPAAECIEVIHQGGGKAILAHPYQLGMTDDALEQQIAQLKDVGLDGIECYYPQHTPEMTRRYLEFAQKYDLYVSGGSDFHGEAVHPENLLKPIQLDVSWLLDPVAGMP